MPNSARDIERRAALKALLVGIPASLVFGGTAGLIAGSSKPSAGNGGGAHTHAFSDILVANSGSTDGDYALQSSAKWVAERGLQSGFYVKKSGGGLRSMMRMNIVGALDNLIELGDSTLDLTLLATAVRNNLTRWRDFRLATQSEVTDIAQNFNLRGIDNASFSGLQFVNPETPKAWRYVGPAWLGVDGGFFNGLLLNFVTGSEISWSIVEGGGQVDITPIMFAVLAHEATHISGGSDPFTSTQLLEAIIKRMRESGGPTDLTVGAIADGEFLKRSGSTIIGSGAINTLKKTSDQTVVGVTLTDITGLSFAVAANTDYHFYFVLVIVTNATTTGYLVTLNGPAIGTGEITYEIRLRTATGAETAGQFGINAYQGGTFSTVGPGTTRVIAIIRGALKNGATAGTLTVQARAEVASPGSVTVKQGSYGTWF